MPKRGASLARGPAGTLGAMREGADVELEGASAYTNRARVAWHMPRAGVTQVRVGGEDGELRAFPSSTPARLAAALAAPTPSEPTYDPARDGRPRDGAGLPAVPRRLPFPELDSGHRRTRS